jgi:hypothetical protein
LARLGATGIADRLIAGDLGHRPDPPSDLGDLGRLIAEVLAILSACTAARYSVTR